MTRQIDPRHDTERSHYQRAETLAALSAACDDPTQETGHSLRALVHAVLAISDPPEPTLRSTDEPTETELQASDELATAIAEKLQPFVLDAVGQMSHLLGLQNQPETDAVPSPPVETEQDLLVRAHDALYVVLKLVRLKTSPEQVKLLSAAVELLAELAGE